LGDLINTVDEEGLKQNTVFIYTSDHGDMLGSQGTSRKQKPWDESILVPFLLRYPELFGDKAREVKMPINTPDIMPTLLGLCDIQIPESVEGINYSLFLKGKEDHKLKAALIECIHPSGEYARIYGGKEYRGIRTEKYTYVRDLKSPWLLYDNQEDPYQMNNLCNNKEYRTLQFELENILQKMLIQRGDTFEKGEAYIKKWGYLTDETGTVPYIP
jgi:arylsulfatase A-like enzyme